MERHENLADSPLLRMPKVGDWVKPPVASSAELVPMLNRLGSDSTLNAQYDSVSVLANEATGSYVVSRHTTEDRSAVLQGETDAAKAFLTTYSERGLMTDAEVFRGGMDQTVQTTYRQFTYSDTPNDQGEYQVITADDYMFPPAVNVDGVAQMFAVHIGHEEVGQDRQDFPGLTGQDVVNRLLTHPDPSIVEDLTKSLAEFRAMPITPDSMRSLVTITDLPDGTVELTSPLMLRGQLFTVEENPPKYDVLRMQRVKLAVDAQGRTHVVENAYDWFDATVEKPLIELTPEAYGIAYNENGSVAETTDYIYTDTGFVPNIISAYEYTTLTTTDGNQVHIFNVDMTNYDVVRQLNIPDEEKPVKTTMTFEDYVVRRFPNSGKRANFGTAVTDTVQDVDGKLVPYSTRDADNPFALPVINPRAFETKIMIRTIELPVTSHDSKHGNIVRVRLEMEQQGNLLAIKAGQPLSYELVEAEAAVTESTEGGETPAIEGETTPTE